MNIAANENWRAILPKGVHFSQVQTIGTEKPEIVALTAHFPTTRDELADDRAMLIASAPNGYRFAKKFLEYCEENCQTGTIQWNELVALANQVVSIAEENKNRCRT